MFTESNARGASVTAHDDRGYWTVASNGVAGQWFACSRSLETAVALATYASLIGESPRGYWQVGNEAPFSLTTRENEAHSEYLANERHWTAYVRDEICRDCQSIADNSTGWAVPTDAPDARLCFDCADYYGSDEKTLRTIHEYWTTVASEAFALANGGATLSDAIDAAFGTVPASQFANVNGDNDPTDYERAIIVALVAVMRHDFRSDRVRCVKVFPRDRGGAIVYAALGARTDRFYRVEANRTPINVQTVNELPA